jgi:hypothetical protein
VNHNHRVIGSNPVTATHEIRKASRKEKAMAMDLKWYLFTGDSVTKMNEGPMLMEPERAVVLDALARQNNLELHECEPQSGDMVAQVRAYALGHYDCGGWDFIVEAWPDSQISEALSVWGPSDTTPHQAADLEEALTKSTLAACVGVWADRQAEADYQGRP